MAIAAVILVVLPLVLLGVVSKRQGMRTIALLLPAVLLLTLAVASYEPRPVSESDVFSAARSGMTPAELIAVMGEPDYNDLDSDGSGYLQYSTSSFGLTGASVRFGKDGLLEGVETH
jgi:hypothetical protein